MARLAVYDRRPACKVNNYALVVVDRGFLSVGYELAHPLWDAAADNLPMCKTEATAVHTHVVLTSAMVQAL